jgi:hypothetical protein
MNNLNVCHLCLIAERTIHKCNGPCPCIVDGRDIIDHAAAADCPRGLHEPGEEMPKMPRGMLWHELPQSLWHELHVWAMTTTATAAEAQSWISSWFARVPCGVCKSHWQKWYPMNPPTLPLFDWTVNAHNVVNAQLGKPIVGVVEARAIYEDGMVVARSSG